MLCLNVYTAGSDKTDHTCLFLQFHVIFRDLLFRCAYSHRQWHLSQADNTRSRKIILPVAVISVVYLLHDTSCKKSAPISGACVAVLFGPDFYIWMQMSWKPLKIEARFQRTNHQHGEWNGHVMSSRDLGKSRSWPDMFGLRHLDNGWRYRLGYNGAPIGNSTYLGYQIVMCSMTSRDPKTSRSWCRYIWMQIFRKLLKILVDSKGPPIENGIWRIEWSRDLEKSRTWPWYNWTQWAIHTNIILFTLARFL